MKKFLIVLLFSSNLWAKNMNDSFTDKVRLLKNTTEGVKVVFELHASFYKLQKSNPNYDKFLSTLQELQKSHKNVKIVVSVSDMEIKELNVE